MRLHELIRECKLAHFDLATAYAGRLLGSHRGLLGSHRSGSLPVSPYRRVVQKSIRIKDGPARLLLMRKMFRFFSITVWHVRTSRIGFRAPDPAFRPGT